MENATTLLVYVGIDVAKDQLDVHILPSGEALAFPNDDAGLLRLTTLLVGLPPALVVLEATGGYEARLAADLAAAGLSLAVVNPRQVRNFARATGRLAKTDRIDAALIALFAERIRPEPRPLPDAQAQALAELVARRRQVVEMIVMEGNRRRCVRNPKVRTAIEATLAMLRAQLAGLRATGASLLYLPPYSPDLNPIEQAFAKLKTLLRKAAARTRDALWNTIGRLLGTFTPAECQNYLANSGYASE